MTSSMSTTIEGLIVGHLPEMAKDKEVAYMQSNDYIDVTDSKEKMPIIYAVYLVHLQNYTPPTILDLEAMIKGVKGENTQR